MSTKIDITPYLADGEKEGFYLSIVKLVGKKIKDIECYISDPYGGGAITVLSKLIFEDGTSMHFEGEHDTAYLSTYGTLYGGTNRKGAEFLVDLGDLHEDYDEDE